LHWGEVHPVLLSEQFVRGVFKEAPVFAGTQTSTDDLARWDRRTTLMADLTGSELFFVAAKPT
jgi:hypothetical protein